MALAASAGGELLEWLRAHDDSMVELLAKLANIETPSRDSTAHAPLFDRFAAELRPLGFRSRWVSGRETGGSLFALPRERTRRSPVQLVLGHGDTVWPRETTTERPVELDTATGRMRGPGVYDMKAGLVQLLFALRALQALELSPSVVPVLFVNSDEEIGSRESTPHIRRLARCANRVFVLEPSLGPEGRLKTARKGVGRFTITVRGRAAHAGLDPEQGVSAILELSNIVQKLFAMNDPAQGVSVNVGQIDGGIGANVIAPESRAVVDVRVPSAADAARIEAAIHALESGTPGAELEIEGRIGRPAMEPTPGNRALWELARRTADGLSIPVEEGAAGGASDGNTTSAFAPTLDGLGPVGDGAHAVNEYVEVAKLPERAALLAALLMAPLMGQEEGA